MKLDDFIPFSPPLFGYEEVQSVRETLESGWVATGPKTFQFECDFANYVGAKYAVAMFSCTSALHLSLVALGIKPGDEVITSPFTFASTAHAICYVGAKPVFVDINLDTLNLDHSKIEEAITDNTSVILPVHYGGMPCEMDQIVDIAKKHGLYIVEDAAHAVGSEYKGRKIGSIGDITCFSFYATKNLSTGEGGMATTNNEEFANLMRRLTMYGISDARDIFAKRYTSRGTWDYDIEMLGFKCNMSDIVAAIGLEQLKKIKTFNEVRGRYSEIYRKQFAGNCKIRLLENKDNIINCWHLFPIILNIDKIDRGRDDIIEKLRKRNVGTSVLFKPLHLHSYYKNTLNHRYGDFPNSEYIYERIINLPISPKIPEDKIEVITSVVNEVIS